MCSSISTAMCSVCKTNLFYVSIIAELFLIQVMQEADKEFRSAAEISRRKLVRSIRVVALFLSCWHVQWENVKFLWNIRNIIELVADIAPYLARIFLGQQFIPSFILLEEEWLESAKYHDSPGWQKPVYWACVLSLDALKMLTCQLELILGLGPVSRILKGQLLLLLRKESGGWRRSFRRRGILLQLLIM